MVARTQRESMMAVCPEVEDHRTSLSIDQVSAVSEEGSGSPVLAWTRMRLAKFQGEDTGTAAMQSSLMQG